MTTIALSAFVFRPGHRFPFCVADCFRLLFVIWQSTERFYSNRFHSFIIKSNVNDGK